MFLSDLWWEEPAPCWHHLAEKCPDPPALLFALLGSAHQHPTHPSAAGSRSRGGQVIQKLQKKINW